MHFLSLYTKKRLPKRLRKDCRDILLLLFMMRKNKMAQLWVLDRLNIYHGWPVVNTEQYIEYMIENGFDDIAGSGFLLLFYTAKKRLIDKGRASHSYGAAV